jgi:6-phosphogluconate dehydrogenase
VNDFTFSTYTLNQVKIVDICTITELVKQLKDPWILLILLLSPSPISMVLKGMKLWEASIKSKGGNTNI